jgi:hypothetical protein
MNFIIKKGVICQTSFQARPINLKWKFSFKSEAAFDYDDHGSIWARGSSSLHDFDFQITRRRRKMSAVFILLISIALVGGCAAFSPKPPGITETEARMVTGCKFLGTVEGRSAWGWFDPEAALERAEVEALHKAVAMGATHLVWTQVESKDWSQRVEGRAYICQ